MSSIIRTVTGDIPSEQLGWFQTHEHLFLEKGKSFEVDPSLCMDSFSLSLQEILQYHRAGGCAFADAQPVGAGRMAECLKRASKESGVHIVGVTGFHKQCFYPEDSFLFSSTENALADLFETEVTDGMFSSDFSGRMRTDARAGLIKVAVEAGGVHMNAAYEKSFSAAAHAAKKTGAAVIAHFDKGADALKLVSYLQERGICPHRLIACHLDRARYDASYHKEVAAAGVWLEYDTVNRLKYHDNRQELDLIEEMVDAGYADRLLLSLDTTNKRLRSYGADMGLDYILKDFSVLLRERGLGGYIQQMMVSNPAEAVEITI